MKTRPPSFAPAKHRRKSIAEQIEFWRNPALPMIEGRRATRTRRGYRDHTHPTWSLGIVDQGSSRVRLGNHRFLLKKGDIVAIPAGCVHSCNPTRSTPGGWSYRMFYVNETWLRKLDDRAPDLISLLPPKLAAAPLRRLERCLLPSGSPGPAEAQLRRSLREVLRLARLHPLEATPPGRDEVFERLKAYIEARVFEPIPVRSLCALSGLSRFQVLRLFKRTVGLTPHAFQIDLRINQARDLLKQGHPPADVAYATGFADQSHLQRSFSSRVAATPGQFRQKRIV